MVIEKIQSDNREWEAAVGQVYIHTHRAMQLVLGRQSLSWLPKNPRSSETVPAEKEDGSPNYATQARNPLYLKLSPRLYMENSTK